LRKVATTNKQGYKYRYANYKCLKQERSWGGQTKAGGFVTRNEKSGPFSNHLPLENETNFPIWSVFSRISCNKWFLSCGATTKIVITLCQIITCWLCDLFYAFRFQTNE